MFHVTGSLEKYIILVAMLYKIRCNKTVLMVTISFYHYNVHMTH